MAKRTLPPAPAGMKWVFRPWRHCPKTNKVLYARTFGFKAWPMLVPE